MRSASPRISQCEPRMYLSHFQFFRHFSGNLTSAEELYVV